MPRAAPFASRLAVQASILPLGLALAAFIAYVPALDHPFVYDDLRTVVANGSLTDLSDWRRILWHDVTRPLVNVTYAIDRALWGPDPRGFHATSALLHAIATVLLFAWTTRFVDDTGRGRSLHLCARCAAGAAALLFAVHPAMTQAVGYVSGRAEVLCAIFLLAGLLSLRSYVLHGGMGVLALGGLAWLFALASKEVAAMLPLVLAAWALATGLSTPASRGRMRLLLAWIVAIGLVAGLSRVLVLWLVEHPREISVFWTHVLVKPGVALRYFGLLVFPAGQSVFHAVAAVDSPWSVRFLLPLLGLATGAAAAWAMRRREPALAFGLAWFLLLIVPSGVLFVVNLGEPMAEQRLYLAGAGVFIVAGVAYAWMREWLRLRGERAMLAAPAALLIAAAALFVTTERRLETWSSATRLWSDAEAKAPGAWVPPLMLGDALDAQGRVSEAAAAYARAAANRGDQPMVWVKLGMARASSGDRRGAEQALERALALDPQSATALNALGALAMSDGRTDDARRRFEAAIAVDAGNVPARQLLAALDEQAGRRDDALRRCQEIQALAPGMPEVAECLARNGPAR